MLTEDSEVGQRPRVPGHRDGGGFASMSFYAPGPVPPRPPRPRPLPGRVSRVSPAPAPSGSSCRTRVAGVTRSALLPLAAAPPPGARLPSLQRGMLVAPGWPHPVWGLHHCLGVLQLPEPRPPGRVDGSSRNRFSPGPGGQTCNQGLGITLVPKAPAATTGGSPQASLCPRKGSGHRMQGLPRSRAISTQETLDSPPP